MQRKRPPTTTKWLIISACRQQTETQKILFTRDPLNRHQRASTGLILGFRAKTLDRLILFIWSKNRSLLSKPAYSAIRLKRHRISMRSLVRVGSFAIILHRPKAR